MWPGVHDAPGAELKEVDRLPSGPHLQHAVKFVQRHGFPHKDAPPDHQAVGIPGSLTFIYRTDPLVGGVRASVMHKGDRRLFTMSAAA